MQLVRAEGCYAARRDPLCSAPCPHALTCSQGSLQPEQLGEGRVEGCHVGRSIGRLAAHWLARLSSRGTERLSSACTTPLSPSTVPPSPYLSHGDARRGDSRRLLPPTPPLSLICGRSPRDSKYLRSPVPRRAGSSLQHHYREFDASLSVIGTAPQTSVWRRSGGPVLLLGVLHTDAPQTEFGQGV